MTKFNIYDETTWAHSILFDLEGAIKNKAMGAISQKIGVIRELKDKLESYLASSNVFDNENNEAYTIARHLIASNKEAAKIMEIIIHYPNEKIANLISNIDNILFFWKDDTVSRELNWKLVLPYLKELRPFIDNDYTFTTDECFKNLCDCKVTGNEAWEEYYLAKKFSNYYEKLYKNVAKSDDALYHMDLKI